MPETFTFILETNTVVQVLLLAFFGFALTTLLTPIYTTVAYRDLLEGSL